MTCLSRKISGVLIAIVLLIVFLNYYFVLMGPFDAWKNGQQGTDLPIASVRNVQVGSGALINLEAEDLYWMSYEFENLASSKTFGTVIINGQEQLVVMNDRSWHNDGLLRFILSIFDPELRYEYGIYLVDVLTKQVSYQFPGLDPVISPNKKYVVFEKLRSNGKHEILVWDPRTSTATTIITLEEADPGSGRSFNYGWVNDHTVRIVGDALHMRDFILEYSVKSNTLRQLQ